MYKKFLYLITLIFLFNNLKPAAPGGPKIEQEEDKIILRFEGRNEKETTAFNKFLKSRIENHISFLIYTAGDYSGQSGMKEYASISNLIGDDTFKNIKANEDIVLPAHSGTNQLFSIEILIRLPAIRFNLAFPVRPNYKYILRFKPCSKDENNLKAKMTQGNDDDNFFCIQEIYNI